MPGRQVRDEEIVAVAREIRNYLDAHPHAADSLEGIVKWWLLRQRYEQSTITVQQALNYLVAHGLVAKQAAPGGEAMYSNAQHEFEKSD